MGSETVEMITMGKLIKLRSNLLKFDKYNPEEGVFFVSSGNTIRVTEYGDITQKFVTMITPQLAVGDTYKVSVRSKFGTDIRIGELKKTVTFQ